MDTLVELTATGASWKDECYITFEPFTKDLGTVFGYWSYILLCLVISLTMIILGKQSYSLTKKFWREEKIIPLMLMCLELSLLGKCVQSKILTSFSKYYILRYVSWQSIKRNMAVWKVLLPENCSRVDARLLFILRYDPQ